MNSLSARTPLAWLYRAGGDTPAMSTCAQPHDGVVHCAGLRGAVGVPGDHCHTCGGRERSATGSEIIPHFGLPLVGRGPRSNASHLVERDAVRVGDAAARKGLKRHVASQAAKHDDRTAENVEGK